LADLGADVIKVERPDGGDAARTLVPGTFAAVNRGKRSVTLNLRHDADREQLYALVRTADVFIEGFRPGVAERLGAGYERLAALNGQLIYCSLSGYGQSGPARNLPGHDLNYLGVAGALDAADDPGVPPRHLASVPMADMAGALFAANTILAALLRRALDPAGVAGAYLDVSLAGASLSLMNGRLGEARRLGDRTAAKLLRGGGYRAFLGSDGRAFTVGCVEDVFWQRLCRAIGRDDLAEDAAWATLAQRMRGAEVLDELLAAEFARRPREECIGLLREADVPVGPVNMPSEVERDPYVAASGLVLADDSSEVPLRAVRFPARMPGLAVAPDAADTRRAPALGEHNAQLLGGDGRGWVGRADGGLSNRGAEGPAHEEMRQ
jgi:crotonobetainyl-CoA:carnitine CoA-transferase CaiB-like acyl-CoA transferase